jgi:hypothetical protein
LSTRQGKSLAVPLRSAAWTHSYLAKGDVEDITATELLQLEDVKGANPVAAYRLGARYFLSSAVVDFYRKVLLRREGGLLISVFKDSGATK